MLRVSLDRAYERVAWRKTAFGKGNRNGSRAWKRGRDGGAWRREKERERERKRRRREESGGIRKGRREDEGGKRGFPVPER